MTISEHEQQSRFTTNDGGTIWPFYEDENGNVTGYGHQDRASFSEQLREYDTWFHGEDASDDAYEVTHCWVVTDAADDERLHEVPSGTDGAIPVTAVWGQR